jgi:hypothetical protein
MAKSLKEYLTEKEISSLINGENSEFEADDGEGFDESAFYSDEDDIPIEHCVAPGILPPEIPVNCESLDYANEENYLIYC